jgi:hypothetical protein
MRKNLVGLSLLLLVNVSCSSDSPDTGSTESGPNMLDAAVEQVTPDATPDTRHDAQPDTNPDAPDTSPETGPPACVRGQAWKSTSTRIEITSFGFFQGSSGYASDRSAMTDAQLIALDGLCVIPTPSGPRGADFTSYVINITDADGTVAHYRAAQDNIVDSDEGPNATLPTIDIHSLEPFLATFHCLFASQTRVPRGSGADGGSDGEAGSPPWTSAPSVETSSPGCLNGVFVPYECADVWLKLNVDRPGTYQLRAVTCLETTTIKIFSPDASTELATASGSEPNCPAVSYRFGQAGTYLVDIQKTNAAGCTGVGSAGDFFLKVSPAPEPVDGSTDGPDSGLDGGAIGVSPG